jgi:hypothetical protein
VFTAVHRRRAHTGFRKALRLPRDAGLPTWYTSVRAGADSLRLGKRELEGENPWGVDNHGEPRRVVRGRLTSRLLPLLRPRRAGRQNEL